MRELIDITPPPLTEEQQRAADEKATRDRLGQNVNEAVFRDARTAERCERPYHAVRNWFRVHFTAAGVKFEVDFNVEPRFEQVDGAEELTGVKSVTVSGWTANNPGKHIWESINFEFSSDRDNGYQGQWNELIYRLIEEHVDSIIDGWEPARD